MNTTEAILAAKDLSVGYKRKKILAHVDMEFFQGEFISLLGPNGAGKTTLLRTLSRHLEALGGQVLINNSDLEKIKQNTLARTMSVVLTEKVAPPLFSVYDFIAMGRYPHTNWSGKLNETDDQVIMEAISMVMAENLIFRELSTLSDGERQKILVARALAQQPEIILLDEPTMHLDLKHRMELMAILQRLCREKGICVVASLHDVEIAAKISDKVALVKNGEIKAFGPPENVLQDNTVSALYDFNNASFNRKLGSIEIKNTGKKEKVFVVGGMGSASILYRLLSKKGYRIVTGVLHKNDIDFHVATSLGARCLVQSHINDVSDENLALARDEIGKCDFVVDTGFELESINSGNITLLKDALAMKKPVLSMRNGQGGENFDTDEHQAMSFSKNESQLVELIEMAEKSL